MKKLIELMCLSLWKAFGKREHVPCRWCIPKVAPLCTDECKLTCPLTKEHDKFAIYRMKKAQKYNFRTKEYEPVEVPDGASMIEYDMNSAIACADCGKHIRFGDSYTSRRIHNQYGFAYMVCPACYSKEWKDIPEQK